MDWYTATRTRSLRLHVRGLFPFYTYRLLLPAEMVWITADQSQINLDFSPVSCVRATRCGYSYYVRRIPYDIPGSYYTSSTTVVYECDHENNQSTHICMDHTKLENCWPLHFGGGIFTTIDNVEKKEGVKETKSFEVSHGPKTRGVCFLLRFNMHLFCLNIHRYTFFWHFPEIEGTAYEEKKNKKTDEANECQMSVQLRRREGGKSMTEVLSWDTCFCVQYWMFTSRDDRLALS